MRLIKIQIYSIILKKEKTMELVNIIYRYINRFINSDELIELLVNIDQTKFSKKEQKGIQKLLKEVKQITENVPIEIDQIEIKRKASLNHILEFLEKIKTNEQISKRRKEFFEKEYNRLIKEKDIVRDSGPRYEKLYDLLVNNPIHINYCKKMNDLELLEFIAQYFHAPVVPNIDQETFDDLVTVGIKEDKREALWRLAFNYCGREKDFTRIENYFIEKRDDYYLTELIHAVQEDLDMEKLTEKAIATKDQVFIMNCWNRVKDTGIFSEQEINILKEKVRKTITESNH